MILDERRLLDCYILDKMMNKIKKNKNEIYNVNEDNYSTACSLTSVTALCDIRRAQSQNCI